MIQTILVKLPDEADRLLPAIPASLNYSGNDRDQHPGGHPTRSWQPPGDCQPAVSTQRKEQGNSFIENKYQEDAGKSERHPKEEDADDNHDRQGLLRRYQPPDVVDNADDKQSNGQAQGQIERAPNELVGRFSHFEAMGHRPQGGGQCQQTKSPGPQASFPGIILADLQQIKDTAERQQGQDGIGDRGGLLGGEVNKLYSPDSLQPLHDTLDNTHHCLLGVALCIQFWVPHCHRNGGDVPGAGQVR